MDIPNTTTVESDSPCGRRSRMNDFTILRGRKVRRVLVSLDVLDVVKSIYGIDEIPFLIGLFLYAVS
jgi:hypothetical protein